MSRLGRMTRRTFLVTSAAVAGGVAFLVRKDGQPVPNPLEPGPGETALNPWLVIDGAGVTIVTPRAEMGQGTQTTLAALVAEELDLAWEDVRVMHGPASASYYNGALLALGMPWKEYAASRWQEAAVGSTDVVARLLGLQVTGGSTAMVDGFEKMRRAGAAARIVLVQAAAARLGLAAERLRTEAGAVIAPDGTRLTYSDLAEAAAGIPPPEDPPLRPASGWKLLGRALPRTDMLAKVTGTAEFGIDVRLPCMLFATVRMNPRLGGPMHGFDAGAARAMPGVVEVLDLGTGFAVVATNTWLAFRAADTVRADWGAAPYPADSPAQMQAIAAAFEDHPNATLRDDGDMADSTGNEISAEYAVPYLAHACMEPMNAAARLDGERLDVWCGTQAPMLVRDHCAAALGLKGADVAVHTTFLGGGFGRRGETDFAVIAARVAAALPGRAVQVTWTREEDMRHDFYRPAALARLRGRVAGGRVTGLEARIAAPSITRQMMRRIAGFAPPGPDKTLLEGAFDQPYAIPNFRVAFIECFLDELAQAAGRDPLELRLELVRPEHAPSAAVLEAVAEMSGWGTPLPEGRARGIAFCHSFGTPTAEVVELVQTDAGIRIARVFVACDPGTALDPGILEAQMTSGALFGLSAAVMGEITFAGGIAGQGNFPDYDALRMNTAPQVAVNILQSGGIGGAGEVATPPAAPALANALFALTGRRARRLPLVHDFAFAL
ncbi:MAG: isoquinoline 1-oxidoreductase [Alphaproteobacteria bacterium HGW-Alphaproteobacteria-2]|nr:MAG: isoquinoline 1-oxidoreductase [Alphaproteobacteria bacterium HGW-Alphaproteobacteria-2]